MLTKFKVFLALAFFVAGSIVVTGSTLARGNDSDDKPGWGWGDKNHNHLGPPGGPSVHPVFVEPELEAELETEVNGDGVTVVSQAKVFFKAAFASFREFTLNLTSDSILVAFK